jgi:tRNA nucleotidyltransferase (CCA-adding enzyme)
MSTATPPDQSSLAARLADLPWLNRLRDAVADAPAYLVGGTVRDLLLDRPRVDIDIAVEGDVGPIAARLGGEVTAHERFGTAVVRVDDLELDLARTRSEVYARPGALPEISPAGIDEDLARRDFTINAMAVPLVAPRLIDPHGGSSDLGRGLLRVLHSASFGDDPTRALRAARYAARFGFSLERGTEALLRSADLSAVSGDRAQAELTRVAAEPSAARGFGLLAEWGLIELSEQELELIASVELVLQLPAWHNVARREDAVLSVVRNRSGRAADLAAIDPHLPSAAVQAARAATPVELVLSRAMGGEWLDRYVEEWRHVKLSITGDELVAAGIPQGPAVGRGLAAALAAKLDGEISSPTEELDVARAAARR